MRFAVAVLVLALAGCHRRDECTGDIITGPGGQFHPDTTHITLKCR